VSGFSLMFYSGSGSGFERNAKNCRGRLRHSGSMVSSGSKARPSSGRRPLKVLKT